MKAKDYRRQVEQELSDRSDAGRAKAAREPSGGDDSGGAAAPESESDCGPILDRLADPAADPETRLKALGVLKAASFMSKRFEQFQPGFRAALQRAATSDHPELRRAALDALANLKDDFARERLIRGLAHADEALVPPAVALGLLAADDHSSVREIARRFIGPEFDSKIRAQAVRLLGGDPDAQALLARLIRDKNEFREVRRASAVALKNLNPGSFATHAREILADRSEFGDIRNTVREAMARSGLSIDEDKPRSVLGQLIDRVRSRFGGRRPTR